MIRSDYENYFDPYTQGVIRNHGLDEATLNFLKNHHKILDAGSGAGVLALKLKELGKDVTCIDIFSKNVEYMKSKGLNALKGNICNLPFKDKEFDCVVCQEVLEHLINPGEGLKELCRIGKNVVFTLPKMFPEEWHFWDIDYVPSVSNANCIIIKLIDKEANK